MCHFTTKHKCSKTTAGYTKQLCSMKFQNIDDSCRSQLLLYIKLNLIICMNENDNLTIYILLHPQFCTTFPLLFIVKNGGKVNLH